MTDNKKSTNGKKKHRKIYKIGLIILVVFIFFLLILDPILDLTVKGMIEDEIKNSENGREAGIGSLSYSLLTNNLSFDDINITLGNNSKFSEKTINIKSSSVEFDGVNWFSFLFSDELSLDKISLTQPYIAVYDSSSSDNPEDSTSGKNSSSLFTMNEIYNSLPEKILPLTMDLFEINKGELVRKTILDSEVVNDTLVNINFALNDIEVTKDNASKKLLIAEEFDLQVDSLVSSNITQGTYFSMNDINISSKESLIQVSKLEYKPYDSIEEYFRDKEFQSECFTINVNDLIVRSINFSSLVKEKFIQVGKISASNFYFDVVTDMRLPSKKEAPPEMPAELLQSLGYKISINKILANGNVYHRDIHPYFNEYAKIFFTNVKCEINNFTNFGNDKCTMKASGNLQDATRLTVDLSIDLTQPRTLLSYSGQLGGMDAQKLNSHVIIEEKVEITSGIIESASYNVTIIDSVAIVSIKPIYHDLSMKVIDEKDKMEKKFQTFLANYVKLRKNNPAEGKEPVTGKVEYVRKRNDAFLDFVWQAILSGLGDVVGF